MSTWPQGQQERLWLVAMAGGEMGLSTGCGHGSTALASMSCRTGGDAMSCCPPHDWSSHEDWLCCHLTQLFPTEGPQRLSRLRTDLLESTRNSPYINPDGERGKMKE